MKNYCFFMFSILISISFTHAMEKELEKTEIGHLSEDREIQTRLEKLQRLARVIIPHGDDISCLQNAFNEAAEMIKNKARFFERAEAAVKFLDGIQNSLLDHITLHYESKEAAILAIGKYIATQTKQLDEAYEEFMVGERVETQKTQSSAKPEDIVSAEIKNSQVSRSLKPLTLSHEPNWKLYERAAILLTPLALYALVVFLPDSVRHGLFKKFDTVTEYCAGHSNVSQTFSTHMMMGLSCAILQVIFSNIIVPAKPIFNRLMDLRLAFVPVWLAHSMKGIVYHLFCFLESNAWGRYLVLRPGEVNVAALTTALWFVGINGFIEVTRYCLPSFERRNKHQMIDEL